jgi:hypothetical protein
MDIPLHVAPWQAGKSAAAPMRLLHVSNKLVGPGSGASHHPMSTDTFQLTQADTKAARGLNGEGFFLTSGHIAFLRSVEERPRDWLSVFSSGGGEITKQMACRDFGWLVLTRDGTMQLTAGGRAALACGASPLQPAHLRFLAWLATPRTQYAVVASGTAPLTWACLFAEEGWISGEPWEPKSTKPVVITDAGRAVLASHPPERRGFWRALWAAAVR